MAITVCVSISVSNFSKPPERRSTVRGILSDIRQGENFSISDIIPRYYFNDY